MYCPGVHGRRCENPAANEAVQRKVNATQTRLPGYSSAAIRETVALAFVPTASAKPDQQPRSVVLGDDGSVAPPHVLSTDGADAGTSATVGPVHL